MVKNKIDVHVRNFIKKDALMLHIIDKYSYREHWSEKDFLDYLQSIKQIILVAEFNSKVLGYVVYELTKNSVEIERIAVDPSYRQYGVGSALINRIKERVLNESRKTINVKVEESNLDAQLFFKNLSFMAVKILRNYYQNPVEDCYLMSYKDV